MRRKLGNIASDAKVWVTEMPTSYDPIQPGPSEITGVPYGERFEQAKTGGWKHFAPFAGQVIFSSSALGQDFREEQLENEFVKGKGEIFARAIWPHALRNYPIAKDKIGKGVLGKSFARYWSLVVFVHLFLAVGPPLILSSAAGQKLHHSYGLFVRICINGKDIGKGEAGTVCSLELMGRPMSGRSGAKEYFNYEPTQATSCDWYSFNQTIKVRCAYLINHT